jgi:hypothetical protein
MEVGGQRYDTAALPWGTGPDTYCRGMLGMQKHEIRKKRTYT